MEERKENKMGVMPVSKLLISMSLPMMISMLVQALYNVVDSIFVAQYSENALTAVSLAFPIQALMIAISTGTGVGINSLLSRRLGQRRYEEANVVAENGLFLAVISAIVFALFGVFCSGAFYRVFTSHPEISAMGTQYVSIVTIFSFGLFIEIACERLMQATGNTIYSMVMQGTGAVINIILDPILIFGWFGLPRMGVAGAALATVIGQILSMFLGLYLNQVKNKEIHLQLRGFRPNGKIIKGIYQVGVPSIIMQSITSVMTVGLNKILILFSATAVSVFGIYFKLQSFIFMPVFGLTNGMIPIVAYNYGAMKKDRILKTIKDALIYAVVIMLLGTIIFQVLPRQLLRLFNASPEMMTAGVVALRTISLSFIFAAVTIILSSVFQAMGNGVLSMVMSITRQLIIILPAAYMLARFSGLNAVWIAFPIAEFLALVMGIFMFRYIYHKLIRNLGTKE